jgi:hypothetical protein
MSLLSASSAVAARLVYRIDHVTDGDTVVLGNARRVRIVQIDTPEVFFGRGVLRQGCFKASEEVLPRVKRVRLRPEPATDRIDQYGQLLRYVVRVRDGDQREYPPSRGRCGRALFLPAHLRAGGDRLLHSRQGRHLALAGSGDKQGRFGLPADALADTSRHPLHKRLHSLRALPV